MGLLDDLKKKAALVQTQQNFQQKLRDENLQSVEGAMQKTFHYVNDLLKQLAIIKPVNPLTYSLAGLVEFSDLAFTESFIDYRKKRLNDRDWFDRVEFYVKWTSAHQAAIERDMPAAIQKARDALWDANIKFAEEEVRSQGKLVRVKFAVPGAVVADVAVRADHEGGMLLFTAKNLLRLGVDDFAVPAVDVNDALLDELAKSLIGEASSFTRYRTVLPR